METRPARTDGGDDQPRRSPADGVARRAPALARVRRLRFHQHARLGEAARASRAAARRRRRAPLRSAGDGAAGPRPARRPGCRDRRAALRRHARPRIPQALRRRREGARDASCGRRSRRPASTRWSSRPATISSTRSCASPICASAAASSPRGGGLPAHLGPCTHEPRSARSARLSNDLRVAAACCGCSPPSRWSSPSTSC